MVVICIFWCIFWSSFKVTGMVYELFDRTRAIQYVTPAARAVGR